MSNIITLNLEQVINTSKVLILMWYFFFLARIEAYNLV